MVKRFLQKILLRPSRGLPDWGKLFENVPSQTLLGYIPDRTEKVLQRSVPTDKHGVLARRHVVLTHTLWEAANLRRVSRNIDGATHSILTPSYTSLLQFWAAIGVSGYGGVIDIQNG